MAWMTFWLVSMEDLSSEQSFFQLTPTLCSNVDSIESKTPALVSQGGVFSSGDVLLTRVFPHASLATFASLTA
jgi:hypothetical protein